MPSRKAAKQKIKAAVKLAKPKTKSRNPKSPKKASRNRSRRPKDTSPAHEQRDGATPVEVWKTHDVYPLKASPNRFVTRSQTGYHRVKRTDSNMELFSNKEKFVVPNCPHLMLAMTGRFGAVPNTIVTRSSGKHYTKDKQIESKLKMYKTGQGKPTLTSKDEIFATPPPTEEQTQDMCIIQ